MKMKAEYMNFISYEDNNGEEVLQYAGDDIDNLCNSFGHRDRRAKMVMLDKTLVRRTVPLVIFLGDSSFKNFECFAGSAQCSFPIPKNEKNQSVRM